MVIDHGPTPTTPKLNEFYINEDVARRQELLPFKSFFSRCPKPVAPSPSVDRKCMTC